MELKADQVVIFKMCNGENLIGRYGGKGSIQQTQWVASACVKMQDVLTGVWLRQPYKILLNPNENPDEEISVKFVSWSAFSYENAIIVNSAHIMAIMIPYQSVIDLYNNLDVV